ncbi:MAG: hypothetical protein A3B74_00110 [Candidatus Kerfeldbacteria bacterium RIFCSPHIGHO2_02_FULL_42_14]|uniref:Transcription regulator TrmB N-terminal domain-containing protein n=1 Tax=Candidatus Kerfeldbacteria bacterium RIFCSPHIGHO2_02_FULL_42_14 TaxID=1798540 RepID=A0A1G2ARH1_9BACT|nr:MAG: hypothetical protein A3B74_00110 [Candidatus Kerfeldbacteria bacterium RIFCSPHIGHO2_02_FULL_42_14]OGY81320.1 MAG: hypothetical protein A3E60_02630 [Candidatus Kerfeldbacteria bacterium RIFCSPHIGHO2_12_FULL_42_13]OGY83594.1 MAG: hypothetical protein A3I91_03060 [Candidatus Kerfeldbacteria bacterium RIFCSPLOWO2_02_FULL_42_19]OGY86692.1 MAG: hypothetical protein A3G01_00565 [Candidatus Kerfeldbacteria bacterium RIFCSPLOWO2_12_FULL_43_9]
MLYKELIQLGLSEKEAKVYLASLELGKATVQKIAEKSGVNRATTYFILESLLKLGLVSTYDQDKKTYFSAEPPELLINLLKKQEAEIHQKARNFENILPELRSVYNLAEDKPRVRFYEGKDGLFAIQQDFLQTNDRKIETVFSRDDVEEVFTQQEREEYLNKRLNKQLHCFAIYTRKGGSFLPDSVGQMMADAYYIPSDKYPISSDITIYDDKIAMASLRGKLSGVIIENKEIANTLRSIFYLALETAKTFRKKDSSSETDKTPS